MTDAADDEETGDERAQLMSDALRMSVAKTLASTAHGLSLVARAMAGAAQQLRPPLNADEAVSATGEAASEAASSTGEAASEAAERATGAASDVSERVGRAGRRGRKKQQAADEGEEQGSNEGGQQKGDSGPSPDDPEVVELAGKSVRALTTELSSLDANTLTALRTAEARGQNRKTVLSNIDRALRNL